VQYRFAVQCDFVAQWIGSFAALFYCLTFCFYNFCDEVALKTCAAKQFELRCEATCAAQQRKWWWLDF
jgi:hypothetical protein